MSNNENSAMSPDWEQHTLQKLLFATLKEQRRRRRWGIFFKILFFLYLFLILMLVWPTDSLPNPNRQKPHIALIDIDGIISSEGSANADNVITGLKDAFKDSNTKSIILRINSPGGSPVQAADIYSELRYLRGEHKNIKVYVVCSDVCASAAYYIAAGGDQIYANPASLVGSIGVLLDGFGFVDTMQKLGVQRRLLTAGDHKGFMDPFSPMNPNDAHYAQAMLDAVHQQFIQSVEQGRGDRLKQNPDTFSGLVWTGSQALPLGLIDGFGDINSVSRDIIKNDNIVDYTYKPGYLEQFANRFGASFSQKLATEFGVGLRE